MIESVFQNTASKSGDRERRLLLVVDGDETHRVYASMLLHRLEYSILTAKTAEEAGEIIAADHPALILTELSLVGLNGVELLKRIKNDPRTFTVPVIILTSSRDQAMKTTCLQEGCAAYLLKPVEPDVLYAAIQKATESHPRQYIRLSTTLNVIIGDDHKAGYAGSGEYITALSEQGMFISTSKPKPVGFQTPITILLEDLSIKVEGVVLYSFQRTEGPLKTSGMGIKFTYINPIDQNIIKVYIKREITKGLTSAHIGGTIL